MKDLLKPYMFSDGEPQEGAVLVFAHTAREAKRVGYSSSFMWGCDYIDYRVQWLRDAFLYKEADQEKLKNGIPHVVENPTACKNCLLWGYEINKEGICENCQEGEL